MLKLSEEIQAAIESESKLLHELQLTGEKFAVNDAVLTSEPTTKPKAAAQPEEKEAQTGFSMAQIRALAKQLKQVLEDDCDSCTGSWLRSRSRQPAC